MRLLTSLALTLSLASPAAAQLMGMANANAPAIEQKIKQGNNSISLNYTAITWAEGRWAAALENQERRERQRERINQTAEQQPLGSFTTSSDVTVAGQQVPTGDYKLMFKLDDKFEWTIVLKNDKQSITIPLPLMAGGGEHEHKRLVLSLYATGDGAGVYCGFGSKMGMLDIKSAGAKPEKKAEEAAGDKKETEPKKDTGR
jgi:hypothetical protein